MTSRSSIVEAGKIVRKEFDELLGHYPDVVKSISESKSVKDGRKTLQELDHYRYVEALKIFGGEKPQRSMHLDDVKELVEWKLRHGKFRPNLMKLVSSNDPVVAADIIKQAQDAYHQTTDAQAALDILTKLKGIGPATASLLLTVHDPDRVIFFSDEAFYWLCCDGKKSPIKYNGKEYKALCVNAQHLSKRLGVSATEVEKVAYVLMKQPQKDKLPEDKAPSKDKKESRGPEKKSTKVSSSKRKLEPEPGRDVQSEPSPILRRSKRTRA
ncbi:hypothetical protein BGZ63DRAFT_398886 [Mariannaea sp. PMI_226]|nr:hypothetical protein BGZ63DRAFT_398886 [Mariannaea sp. PMI_226]